MSEPNESASRARDRANRYFGKYRGVVTNNIDPLGLQRLMVMVPAIPHDLDMWAVACVPFAGTGVGLHLIPPIGANVWVEFEGGNPSYPVWTGAYWEDLEFVPPKALNPIDTSMVKMLKTIASTFVLDDTPGTGGMTLESAPPAIPVPATMKFDAEGISLECGPATITMSPVEGITATMGPSSIEIGPQGIKLTAPTLSITAQQSVSVTSPGKISLQGVQGVSVEGAQVGVKGTGTVSVEATGSCAVKSSAALSLEGTATAELKGGGLTTITGGIVKIN